MRAAFYKAIRLFKEVLQWASPGYRRVEKNLAVHIKSNIQAGGFPQISHLQEIPRRYGYQFKVF